MEIFLFWPVSCQLTNNYERLNGRHDNGPLATILIGFSFARHSDVLPCTAVYPQPDGWLPVCHVPETQISLVARTGRMRNISYPVSLYSVCPMRLPSHILFWSGQPNCSALESMASVHCTFLDYVPIGGWAGGVAGFCGFEWGPNGQCNCRQSRKWDDNVIT